MDELDWSELVDILNEVEQSEMCIDWDDLNDESTITTEVRQRDQSTVLSCLTARSHPALPACLHAPALNIVSFSHESVKHFDCRSLTQPALSHATGECARR